MSDEVAGGRGVVGGPSSAGQPEPTGYSVNDSKPHLRRNILTSYAAFLLQTALGLVLAPALLRGLGETSFGVFTVIGALASYVGVAELGLGTATVRAVAATTAQGDRREVGVLASTSLVLYLVVAGVGSIVLGAMIVLLPHMGVREDLAEARFALLLLGGAQAVALVLNVYPALLFGSGRSSSLATVGGAGAILGGLLQILAALLTGDLLWVALAGSMATAFSAVAIAMVAARQLPGLRLSAKIAQRAVAVRLLRSGWRNAVIGLSAALAFNTDALVVGWILGATTAAAYGVAARAAGLIGNLSNRLSDVLVPTFAHFAKVNDRERVYGLYRDTVVAGLVIAIPAAALVLTTGHGLLHLWLGSVPAGSDSVLAVLVCAAVIAVPGAAAFRLLSGMDRLRFVAVAAAASALVNLVIGVTSTHVLGLIGPALGTLVTALVYDVLVMPTHACRVIGVPVWRLVRDVAFLVTPAVVCLMAGMLVRRLGEMPVEVAVRSLVIGAVYLPVLVLAAGRSRRARCAVLIRGKLLKAST